MPTNPTVSIVFVGGPFTTSLFNEHELESHFGPLDSEGLLKVGPIGQFSYSAHKFQFTLNPERIDLKGSNVDFMPDELLNAAKTIIHLLDPVRSVVRVTGFGINCDTLFDKGEVGKTALDFCLERLVARDSLAFVGGDPYMAVSSRYFFERFPVRFDVRFEPHSAPESQQLLIAVNGHQEVSQEISLLSLLDAVPVVQEYVDSLHKRILSQSGQDQ